VIVAAVDDYACWKGSDPPNSPPPTKVHFWGQFTRDLEARFQPNGPVGHQYFDAPDFPSALAFVDDLRAFVLSKWPGVGENREETLNLLKLKWTLPSGQVMRLELCPDSHYAVACNVLAGPPPLAAALVEFEPSHRALFWEPEGASLIDIGISDGGREFVLLRVWVNDDEELDVARAFIRDLPPKASDDTGGVFELRGGAVVVAWSPCELADIVNANTPAALTALAKGPVHLIDIRGMAAMGAVLDLSPGSYQVTTGMHDPGGGSWSCVWCRLTKLAEA
jgi:hypothetical protein